MSKKDLLLINSLFSLDMNDKVLWITLYTKSCELQMKYTRCPYFSESHKFPF